MKMKSINNRQYKTVVLFAMCLFSGCNLESKKCEQIDSQENDKIEYILKDSLSSKDYASYDGYNPKDGFIATPEQVVKIAEVALSKIYGKENIEKQKPFSINLENGIWLIEGYSEDGYDGGVVYMEIKKNNGEILKVIHGK